MRFRSTFIQGTRMRDRLEAIVAGEPDPYPESSGNEHVEKLVRALSEGQPNPYGEVMLATKIRERKLNEYPIVTPVAAAFVELFENLNGGA